MTYLRWLDWLSVAWTPLSGRPPFPWRREAGSRPWCPGCDIPFRLCDSFPLTLCRWLWGWDLKWEGKQKWVIFLRVKIWVIFLRVKIWVIFLRVKIWVIFLRVNKNMSYLSSCHRKRTLKVRVGAKGTVEEWKTEVGREGGERRPIGRGKFDFFSRESRTRIVRIRRE